MVTSRGWLGYRGRVTHDAAPASPLDFATSLGRLDEQARRFAAAADRVEGWGALVPACPGWTVRELVIHLGTIHAWAAASIGAEHAPAEPPFEDDGTPLPEWYRVRAAALLAALRAAGPEAPAWTLWGDRVAAFWARRQVHETAVHAFDLVASLAAGAAGAGAAATADALTADAGHEPWSVPDAVALDGLREVLTGFYPRQVRLGRTAGLPGAVRFEVRTDGGAPLDVLEAPALGAPYGEASQLLGTVSGTASELYLAIWGRGPLPGASAELAEAVRAARLTP